MSVKLTRNMAFNADAKKNYLNVMTISRKDSKSLKSSS